MRLTIASLLAAAVLFAANYPQPSGHVNDYAGELSADDRQALEDKLRAYEQSTSIEVAVAIVSSLEGQTVDDYARELFQTWGIGKRDKNNGVLFLWAPVERKVRIQVGYGLESVLSNSDAAEIVRQVTTLFRQEEYTRGVYAAVDGILYRLDHSSSNSMIPVAALVAGLAVLISVVLVLQFRRHKRTELVETLPRMLEAGGRQLDLAVTSHARAVKHLAELRQEAPAEVWAHLDAELTDAPQKLAELRQTLGQISTHPRQQYRELREVERSIKRWQRSLARLTEAFNGVDTLHSSFGDARRSSQELMADLPGRIAGCAGGDSRLMDAARATYAKAQEARMEQPANWLLVYDLLLDTQDCVRRAQGLTQGERLGARPRVGRHWAGSEVYSPAIVVIDTMFPPVVVSSSSGMGASSGGSDFGGFGGGDSGSGGASGSY